jgi:hypothetical protein
MATLDELNQRRAAYLAAEAKILKSQEYTVGQGGNASRNVRAELATVREGIADLDAQIEALNARGQRRVYTMVPR